MKTILLGALDPGLSSLVSGAFDPLKEEFTLQTVGSMGELLVLLETSQGDLLFLDLDSPDGVALEWLAQLAEIKSSIPILGAGRAERPDITGYERRFPNHFFPFLTYLRKPLTAEDILATVQSELRHVARGVIEGLSLATLLQMFHMEGKTCTIRVNSGRRQGFFYMRAGQIINARYRRKEGMEAALLLLASASPKAEIDGQLHDSTQLIHARIEELMMEAMRIQDEHTRDHGVAEEDDDEDDENDLPRSETGKWDTAPAAKTAPVRKEAPPPPRRRKYLLIAAAVILPFTAIPFFIPREVSVGITSSPPGASVILDGRPQGRTPLDLTMSKPLQGTLKVELTGYQTQTHLLKPGEEAVSFALAPVPQPEPVPVPVASTPPMEKPAPPPAPKQTRKPPAKKHKDIFDQVRNP